MQPDLLQQLHDLHQPALQGFWPPAPGWWLLMLLALYLVGLLLRRMRNAYQRRAPFKQARKLYTQLHASYRSGQTPATLYLHQSNELLKRLVIFGCGDNQARKANDQEWLAILDKWSGSSAFTDGAGRALGNQRFAALPEADVDALHPLLQRFFDQAQP